MEFEDPEPMNTQGNTQGWPPMYARPLSEILHRALAEPGAFDDTLKRFESLRGYGLLPRGRESAGVRLSDEQIASAVLGFVPKLPGWAGHVSLVLGSLCAVGGLTFVIELKKHDGEFSREAAERYRPQATSYQAANVRLGFLGALELIDRRGPVPSIEECLWHSAYVPEGAHWPAISSCSRFRDV